MFTSVRTASGSDRIKKDCKVDFSRDGKPDVSAYFRCLPLRGFAAAHGGKPPAYRQMLLF